MIKRRRDLPLKKLLLPILLLTTFLMITGSCMYDVPQQAQKVAVLFEESIQDRLWNQKGYEGLIQIKEKYDIDVFYEENIQTKLQVLQAVENYSRQGIDLIFGHSSLYGRLFAQIAHEYPNIHFIYFNDHYVADNLTSINFNSLAMGFFSGMIASKMSSSNHVGVIAAYKWQAEIEGFYEGVKFQDPMTQVHINFLNSWKDEEVALSIYETMRKKNVDVIYPASDSFNQMIIEEAGKDDIYVIGYLEDQLDLDPSIVLTSTIQKVDEIYTSTVQQYNEQRLLGGIQTVDFADGFISLGKYNDEIPDAYQELIQQYLDRYIDISLLPHEQ